MRLKRIAFVLAATLFATRARAAAPDPVQLANGADVMKSGISGAAATAVHEVTDTAGKTEKQIYRVLNQIGTGASFIVISSENTEVNGTVYLIKSGVLYAAAPNQRSFSRLGSLNLDRRISGSLFSHWDLQGNLPLGTEYLPVIASQAGDTIKLELKAKAGSHYTKIDAELDGKNDLYRQMSVYDAKGLLKTITYSKPMKMGTTLKKRMPTVVLMKRADGRSDLPVAQTKFVLTEVEFNPEVDYADLMAATDQNLQKLRSKYVLSTERFRAVLSEAQD